MSLSLLLALLSAPHAHAHAGADLTAVDVERPDVLETGFGVLLQQDDSWLWTCHEAVTTASALITPRYSKSPADVFLVAVQSLEQARDEGVAIYRSTDSCSWDPVAGMADQSASDVVFLDADVAIAVTADLRPGRESGVFRTTDGGLTFSQVLNAGVDRPMLRVIAGGPSTAWAASFDPRDASAARVHVTQDAGETWQTHPIDLGDLAGDATLAVSVLAADGERAWVGAGVPTGHVLLHTQDGGETWSRVLTVTGALLDGAVGDDGAVWISEGPVGVWRATDGTTFQAVDAPPAIGLGLDGSDALLATSSPFTGALSYRLTASGERDIRVTADEISGPLICPEGTEQHDICEPLWTLVEQNLTGPAPVDPDTGDTDGGDESEGCGCTSAATPPLAWLGLLLLAPWWRRR